MKLPNSVNPVSTPLPMKDEGADGSDMSQAWKFGGNNRFVTASFPSLIKDGNDNSFP